MNVTNVRLQFMSLFRIFDPLAVKWVWIKIDAIYLISQLILLLFPNNIVNNT